MRHLARMASAAPHKPEPGFREFVGMIAAMMAMTALAIDSMLPALPDIGNGLGVTDENDRQWVIAIFLFGFGAMQIVYGTLSDRFGRKPVLFWGYALYVAFSLLAALAPSFTVLLIARFMQGAALAASRVIAVAIVRDRFGGRQMARVMSLAFIVFMAAPILAPAMGQIVLFVAPWRWIFGILAIAGLAVMLWVMRRMPETLHPEYRLSLSFRRIGRAFRHAATERYSVGYTLGLSLMQGALIGFLTSAQQLFFDVFRHPLWFTPVFALIASTMALANWQNSRIVERLGTRFIAHWALIGFIAVSAVHLVVALAGLESIYIFAIFQALVMGCFGLAAANFGAMAMENMSEIAGSASSVQGCFSTVLGTAIGIGIGQAFNGTTVPFVTGFLICGLASLAVILIAERGKLFGRAELDSVGGGSF